MSRRSPKVFEKITALQLPRDIEEKAAVIYKRLPSSIKAGKKAPQIAHLCIAEAHKLLHQVYKPQELAKQLKVTNPNDLLKEAGRLGYTPVICHYVPHDWLKSHMRSAGVNSDHYEELKDMVDLVLEKSPQTHEKTPESVAAGVVAFFALINGYDQFDERKFSQKVGVSLNIIKQMKKIVSRAHAQ